MKFVSLQCPNCYANLEVEDGIDTFRCKHCGYKILLDGQSKYAYKTKTKLKAFEHEEKLADKHYDYEKYKFKETLRDGNRAILLGVGMIFVCILICFIMVFIEDKQENNEESRLEEIVVEVQEAIDNNDFDEAYIKSQSIVYTKTGNDSLKEKWDNTRKEVIDRIIEAEIKETGKSTHKSENNSFWENIKDIFN